MAKRPQANSDDALLARVRRDQHLAAIGLTEAEYVAWCDRHGLSRKRRKTEPELATEERLRKREVGSDALRRARRQRRPAAAVRAALRAPDRADELGSDALRRAVRAAATNDDAAASLVALLETLDRKSRLLDGAAFVAGDGSRAPYIDGIVRIWERRGQWLRAPEDWRPRAKNRERQFGALARHLLADYDVPVFLDAVWFRTDQGSHAYRDGFVHLGRGGRVRDLNTPVPLTKKVGHHFLRAPDGSSVEQALRWGQIRALGGDGHLCHAVNGTRLAHSFAHDDFWQSVLRFFIAHPMLDRSQVGPVVDWLYAQRFETIERVVGPGRVEVEPPPQPHLSMRGRTPATVLREVDRWHTRLGNADRRDPPYWRKSGIDGFYETSGTGKSLRTVRIDEILDLETLAAEGRAMEHCVVSYARSCARGQCSVWSVRHSTPDAADQRWLTVEVSRQRVLVQARGKRNALPTQQQRTFLAKWAQSADLRLSRWI